jgi:hypothetical protein
MLRDIQLMLSSQIANARVAVALEAGLPTKPSLSSQCGDPNHAWSTCKAPYADVLRWTLAKRKQMAEKYAGQPPPAAHLSDVPADMASVEDPTDGEPLDVAGNGFDMVTPT